MARSCEGTQDTAVRGHGTGPQGDRLLRLPLSSDTSGGLVTPRVVPRVSGGAGGSSCTPAGLAGSRCSRRARLAAPAPCAGRTRPACQRTGGTAMCSDPRPSSWLLFGQGVYFQKRQETGKLRCSSWLSAAGSEVTGTVGVVLTLVSLTAGDGEGDKGLGWRR